jgi:DNA-binding transcriptional ArsR family regulator
MSKARSKAPKQTSAAVQATAERRRATQQLRALAHPLRIRLVEAFAQGRRTTMQVAEEMGEPPTRLYHHVNALERARVLRLVDRRQVRGATEKYYELASRTVGRVPRELTGSTRASLTTIANAVFDEARTELLAAVAEAKTIDDSTAPLALRMLLSLPASKVPRVRQRILALLKQLQREHKAARPAADGKLWALTLGFAPSVKATKR